MSEHWYIGVQGEQSGPFDRATVEEMRQDGRVAEDTLVWHEGMENWVSYADSGLRAPLLPPLPSPETRPPASPPPQPAVCAPDAGPEDEPGTHATDPISVSDTDLPQTPNSGASVMDVPRLAQEGTTSASSDGRGLSMRGHLIILATVAFGLAYIHRVYVFGHAGIPETLGAAAVPLLIAGTVAWYRGPAAGYATLGAITTLLIVGGGRSRSDATHTPVNNEAASALGWTPFVSESERWTGAFPEEPEMTSGSTARAQIRTHQAPEFFDDGAILYSVAVATAYGIEGPLQGTMPASDYLHRELQESLLHFDEAGLAVDDFEFADGYPAIRFSYRFTAEGERLRCQGMWILLPDRSYKVSAFYHEAIHLIGSRRYSTFTNSFGILDLESDN